MNKSGPILLIDNDEDDLLFYSEVLADLKIANDIIKFDSTGDALDFLNANENVEPFLIISDMHLPKLTGIELRDKLHTHEQFRLRCIPFLIFTTTANRQDAIEAYSRSIQGFFTKPVDIKDLKVLLQTIISYWSFCKAPDLKEKSLLMAV